MTAEEKKKVKGKQEAGQKSKTKKKARKKVKVIQWYYDNGDVGAVLKGKKDYFHHVTLESEAEINKELKWRREQEEKGKLKIKDEKTYKLPVGMSTYFNQYEADTSWGINQRKIGLEEFKKMIRANGVEDAQQLIARLTALVLSGYWIRLALEIPDIHNAYPIEDMDASLCAYVTKCEDIDSFTALKKVCGSIMVSTKKRGDKHFKIHAPTLLPKNREKDIMSTAWIRLKGDKEEHPWPAPYRDMAVLWDRGFLSSPKELKGFMRQNPWCTCVIFGEHVTYPKRIEIKLKGKDILDRLKVDWNGKPVKKLVATYVIYMNKYFSNDGQGFLRIWNIAGERLKLHLKNKGATEKRNSECLRDRLLLSALISFVEFVCETCQLPPDEAGKLQKELLVALLPGCYPKVEGQEEKEAEDKSSREHFEQVLQALITTENLAHFYAIKKGQKIWLEKTEDEIDIWGYVREYKEKEKLVPYVVLLRDDLMGLAKTLCPQITSFSNVLTELRKEKLVYLHSTANARIKRSPAEPTESVTAYRLNLQALPISEECKQALLHKLEE